MKLYHLISGIIGSLLLSSGDLMAQQLHPELPQHWVTVKDEETGLRVDFPQSPLEMTFHIPSQNTPSKGLLHVYSLPNEKGILILSTFHSSSVDSKWIEKESIHQFFETILVPHLFFNPAIFQDQQIFNFQSIEIKGQESASFEFSFLDHKVLKKLEGIAQIKDQTLYISFYLASEKNFDQGLLNKFLSSIQFP